MRELLMMIIDRKIIALSRMMIYHLFATLLMITTIIYMR